MIQIQWCHRFFRVCESSDTGSWLLCILCRYDPYFIRRWNWFVWPRSVAKYRKKYLVPSDIQSLHTEHTSIFFRFLFFFFFNSCFLQRRFAMLLVHVLHLLGTLWPANQHQRVSWRRPNLRLCQGPRKSKWQEQEPHRFFKILPSDRGLYKRTLPDTRFRVWPSLLP